MDKWHDRVRQAFYPMGISEPSFSYAPAASDLLTAIAEATSDLLDDDRDDSVDRALQRAGRALGAARLLVYTFERPAAHLVYAWLQPGADAPPKTLDASNLDPWMRTLTRGAHVQQPWPEGDGTMFVWPILHRDRFLGVLHVDLAVTPDRVPTGVEQASQIMARSLGAVFARRMRSSDGVVETQLSDLPPSIRRVLVSSSEPLFIVRNRRCLFANQAFQAHYGYDAAAIEAAGGIARLLGPGDVRAHVRDALADTSPLVARGTLMTRHGRTVPMRLSLDVIRDDEEVAFGLLGICRYLDGAPDAPDAVVASAKVMAQMHDRVLAVDADAQVCYTTEACEAMLYGTTAQPGAARPFADLLAVEDAPNAAHRACLDALASGQAWQGALTIRAGDGSTRAVAASLAAVETPAGPGAVLVLEQQAAEDSYKHRVEHRVRVETALVRASRELVSSGNVDFEHVLGIVGEAVGTESVYLVIIPPDKEPLQDRAAEDVGMNVHVWHRDGTTPDDWWRLRVRGAESDAWALVAGPRVAQLEGAESEPTALAVPVLSQSDMLYGYLGFEYGDQAHDGLDEDIRVLNLLGDLLATYFERNFAEAALRTSEERYRSFVSTITEGIWRLDFTEAVDVSLPPPERIDAIARYGRLAECNRVMAALFGLDDPERLTGKHIRTLVPTLERRVVADFVHAGHVLQSREYAVTGPAGERNFVVNAVGTIEEGLLQGVWGSCIEVTERVKLERRMVAALEEQQQRIGRDLHDGVGQLLTGIRMLSSNLAERFFKPDEDGHDTARKVARFAHEASQRVREIYRGLTPTQLYYEGLSAALEELAYNTNALPGVRCIFSHDEQAEVHEREAKLHLYRIAQEAVNNALKHAAPSEIMITFKRRGDDLLLRIQDDGEGFELGERRGKSLGLDSMNYRARAVRATYRIDTEPGSGTVIECVWPWAAQQDAEGRES